MANQLSYRTIGVVAAVAAALLLAAGIGMQRRAANPDGSAGSSASSEGAGATSSAAHTSSSLPEADKLLLASLVLEVHKSPTCSCCQKWVEHMRASGFTVVTHDHDDVAPVKKQLGVSQELASCHTSKIGDYVKEGHVPASDVIRLLREKPAGLLGLAAPGMPVGSPGMEASVADNYDVLSFDKSGTSKVYAKHGPGSGSGH
jgi:hypothetical protein